jgi:hypothetical protein
VTFSLSSKGRLTDRDLDTPISLSNSSPAQQLFRQGLLDLASGAP